MKPPKSGKGVHRNNARAPYKPTVYMEVPDMYMKCTHTTHTHTHTSRISFVIAEACSSVHTCPSMFLWKNPVPYKTPHLSPLTPPYVAFNDHVQVCANCAIGQFTNDITIMRSVLIPHSPKIMLPSTKHHRVSQRLPKPTRYQHPRDPPW